MTDKPFPVVTIDGVLLTEAEAIAVASAVISPVETIENVFGAELAAVQNIFHGLHRPEVTSQEAEEILPSRLRRAEALLDEFQVELVDCVSREGVWSLSKLDALLAKVAR